MQRVGKKGHHGRDMPSLSLGYLSLPGANATQLVHAAHAAGLHRIGVRIGGRQPDDAGDWPVAGGTALQSLRLAMDATGVAVMNVSAHYLGAATPLASYGSVFDTAAKLGARFVCLSSYDPEEARLSERLAQLTQTARSYGLALALEFVPYSATRTLDAAARVIAAAGITGLGVLLDLLHFMRSGSSLESLLALPATHLAFVQLCDGARQAPPQEKLSEEARGGRLYPGEGAFPLHDILAALPADVPLEIEVPHARMAGRPFDEQAIAAAAAVQSFLRALPSGASFKLEVAA
ncbi:MAG: sugar phosphate isomerase/epimerase [Polaromonas sp.]|nr:sugar phosphate isomerase/epimerase [Polaromonas sp.]